MFDIIISNFGVWFNFLIPVVIAGYLAMTHKEYIWKEFGIQTGVTFVYVALAYTLLFTTTANLRDTEFWNGSVKKFEYYEEWTEEVEYTEEVCSGSGKDRSCRTVTKTRHDYHSPYWQIVTTNGEKISIKRDKFRKASIEFGKKEVDIYRPDQVSFGDGDKYVSTPTKLIPTSYPHSYTNYVTAANKNVIHTKVSPEEIKLLVKEKKLKRYPKVYRSDYGEPILRRVIDTTSTGLNTNTKFFDDLTSFSAVYGKTKQMNPIVYVTDQDRTFKSALETYWNKAKKNDIILLLGVNSDGIVQWSDVIAWTNNTDFLVDMTSGYNGIDLKTDSDKVLTRMVDLIIKDYERKPMKEFEYLKENITLDWKYQVLVFLGNVVLSFFVFRYFLKNYNGYSSSSFGRRRRF